MGGGKGGVTQPPMPFGRSMLGPGGLDVGSWSQGSVQLGLDMEGDDVDLVPGGRRGRRGRLPRFFFPTTKSSGNSSPPGEVVGGGGIREVFG